MRWALEAFSCADRGLSILSRRATRRRRLVVETVSAADSGEVEKLALSDERLRRWASLLAGEGIAGGPA